MAQRDYPPGGPRERPGATREQPEWLGLTETLSRVSEISYTWQAGRAWVELAQRLLPEPGSDSPRESPLSLPEGTW